VLSNPVSLESLSLCSSRHVTTLCLLAVFVTLFLFHTSRTSICRDLNHVRREASQGRELAFQDPEFLSIHRQPSSRVYSFPPSARQRRWTSSRGVGAKRQSEGDVMVPGKDAANAPKSGFFLSHRDISSTPREHGRKPFSFSQQTRGLISRRHSLLPRCQRMLDIKLRYGRHAFIEIIAE
jgi:hypothetical protein